jgi:hypothetical protein
MQPTVSPRVSPAPDTILDVNVDAVTPGATASQQSPKSTPKPKMRRKVTVEDALATSTAVQRLVEYFVVVSSLPRWENAPRLQTPEPKGRTKTTEEKDESEETPAPKTEKKKPIVFDTPRQPQRQTTNIDPGNMLSPEPLNPPTTKKKPKPLAERFRFRQRDDEVLTRTSFDGDEKKEDVDGYHESSSPTPRSEWTREDGPTENIHMPTDNYHHSFQPMITARFPLMDHKGKILQVLSPRLFRFVP